MNESKENIKGKIQNVFTKLRSELNDREEELLQETDEICNKLYCTESIVKEGEKLPDKTKLLLEKAQDINKVYDQNNTSLFINGCINVESNIKTIIELNENIKKCNNSINQNIYFNEEKEEMNKFTRNIKRFGKIYFNKFEEKTIEAMPVEGDIKIKVNDFVILSRASVAQNRNIIKKIMMKSLIEYVENKRLFKYFKKWKNEEITDNKIKKILKKNIVKRNIINLQNKIIKEILKENTLEEEERKPIEKPDEEGVEEKEVKLKTEYIPKIEIFGKGKEKPNEILVVRDKKEEETEPKCEEKPEENEMESKYEEKPKEEEVESKYEEKPVESKCEEKPKEEEMKPKCEEKPKEEEVESKYEEKPEEEEVKLKCEEIPKIKIIVKNK